MGWKFWKSDEPEGRVTGEPPIDYLVPTTGWHATVVKKNDYYEPDRWLYDCKVFEDGVLRFDVSYCLELREMDGEYDKICNYLVSSIDDFIEKRRLRNLNQIPQGKTLHVDLSPSIVY